MSCVSAVVSSPVRVPQALLCVSLVKQAAQLLGLITGGKVELGFVVLVATVLSGLGGSKSCCLTG